MESPVLFPKGKIALNRIFFYIFSTAVSGGEVEKLRKYAIVIYRSGFFAGQQRCFFKVASYCWQHEKMLLSSRGGER